MNPERKPWLFLKRLERWSPLAAVRPMLTPLAADEQVEPLNANPKEQM